MIRLLLLPFLLIRRLLWLPFWHTVYFFLKKPKRLLYLSGFILLAMVGLVYYINMPQRLAYQNTNQPQAAQSAGNTQYQSVSKLPPMTGPVEDGNSAFTQSLAEQMQPQDLQNYSRYFTYAMASAPANKRFQWVAAQHLFGRITPQPAFRNGSGEYCRHFSELLSYYGKNQKYSGVSCQRPSGGWCKLRPNSAYTCELGRPNTFKLWLDRLF